MATQVTVITGEGSTTYSVSTGARGPAGPAGGGGGGGGVTNVATGTGLTGGPITTTGTVSLANTAVTAEVYQSPFVQVDAQGRLTKALDEPCSDEIHFSGSVLLNNTFLAATRVEEWDNAVVSAVARTGIFAGISAGTNTTIYESFNFNETVDHIDFLSVTGGGFDHRFTLTKSDLISQSASGIIVRWTGFVNATSGTILPSRPAICILRIASNLAYTLTLKVQKEFLYTGTSPVVVTGRAISLAATTSAGIYTNANITVDAQGRITAAANGSAAGAVTVTAPIVLSGAGAVGLSTTLPSAYAFTSTTRPTSSGTGTPVYGASPSLIHSNDFLTEQMFTRAQVRTLPIFSLTTNGGSATAANDAITLQNTAIASGYAQGLMSRVITHATSSTGSNTVVTIPLMFSFCGVVDVPTAGTAAVRFLCGANGLPMYDSNAFTARGVGWEIYYSTANTRVEIRIISHDGTSYNTSTGVAFAATNDKFINIILEILGTGTVNLYGSASSSGANSACPRPSNTPLITITNGPSGSGNRYGAAHSTIGTVTNAAGSYGVAMFKIQDAMIKVG